MLTALDGRRPYLVKRSHAGLGRVAVAYVRDARAIGRERGRTRRSLTRGKPHRLSASNRNEVDVRYPGERPVLRLIRDNGDSRAVRAPRRRGVIVLAVSELRCLGVVQSLHKQVPATTLDALAVVLEGSLGVVVDGDILHLLVRLYAGRRGERYLRAVGAPSGLACAVLDGCHLARLASVGGHHVHLRLAVAVREEQQRAAVARPARAVIFFGPVGVSGRLGGAVGRHYVDGGAVLVALTVNVSLDVRYSGAVRRELRVADVREAVQVLGGYGPGL